MRIPAWKEATFILLSPGYKTFKAAEFANVFSGANNSIIKIAPELEGLTGIKTNSVAGFHHSPLSIQFNKSVLVLIGVTQDTLNVAANLISKSVFMSGGRSTELLLKNAVTVTGLPPVDVYAIPYPKGAQSLDLSSLPPSSMVIGFVEASQKMTARDARLPDGRLWEPFSIEGFADGDPLFQILGGPDEPVLDEGAPGTEDIQGGFEAGAGVKVGGNYHIFPTERAGEKGVAAYYDRVKTRIGHWVSADAVHWTRVGTLYRASGTYAVTDDDNPVNDRRGAIWSFNPVFNKEKNRWYAYYLTYTVSKTIAPNHSFGRIWQTESETGGMEGIGGPYKEGKVIMEPGMDSQLWEGRQGVASFFPYPVKDGWLAFYAGAYPYLKKEDYPAKTGKGWFVGLAKSTSLEGPWMRLDSSVNPVKTIHPWFVENPLVYGLANGLYLAVFDGGPEGWGHHLPNMVGYTLSLDGVHWTEARYLPFASKAKKWWDIMRTPMCLIDEGNNVFTLVYAAIRNDKRFHPLGMIRIKLNETALKEKRKELSDTTAH